jgi:ankyrin repeat protein
VKSNSIKTVMLLKQFPALINRQNKKGNTPLHEAVASNNYRFVKLLMNAGANPVVLNKVYRLIL